MAVGRGGGLGPLGTLLLVVVMVVVVMLTCLPCTLCQSTSNTTECSLENQQSEEQLATRRNVKWPKSFWRLYMRDMETRVALYVYVFTAECTLGPICIPSEKNDIPVWLVQEQRGNNITRMNLTVGDDMRMVNLTSRATHIGVVYQGQSQLQFTGGSFDSNPLPPSNASSNPIPKTVKLPCRKPRELNDSNDLTIPATDHMYPDIADEGQSADATSSALEYLPAVGSAAGVLLCLIAVAATLFFKQRKRDRMLSTPEGGDHPLTPTNQITHDALTTPGSGPPDPAVQPRIKSPGCRATSPAVSQYIPYAVKIGQAATPAAKRSPLPGHMSTPGTSFNNNSNNSNNNSNNNTSSVGPLQDVHTRHHPHPGQRPLSPPLHPRQRPLFPPVTTTPTTQSRFYTGASSEPQYPSDPEQEDLYDDVSV